MAWLAAFIVGVSVGLLGSGGSILNIPILVYVVGEPEKAAIAESLVIVGVIATFAAVPYARKKLIVWRSVVLFGLPGMLGAYLGAALAEFVPAQAQLALLSVIMLVAAFFMFQPPAANDTGAPRAYWKIASDGLMVGILTGLVGVGGGFLIVPTLALLGGLAMHEAIGTSLVIIALKSLSGYVKYHEVLAKLDQRVNWELVALFIALGVIGSFLGGLFAHRIPQIQLRRIFAVALVAVGAYVAVRNIPSFVFAIGSGQPPGAATELRAPPPRIPAGGIVRFR